MCADFHKINFRSRHRLQKYFYNENFQIYSMLQNADNSVQLNCDFLLPYSWSRANYPISARTSMETVTNVYLVLLFLWNTIFNKLQISDIFVLQIFQDDFLCIPMLSLFSVGITGITGITTTTTTTTTTDCTCSEGVHCEHYNHTQQICEYGLWIAPWEPIREVLWSQFGMYNHRWHPTPARRPL